MRVSTVLEALTTWVSRQSIHFKHIWFATESALISSACDRLAAGGMAMAAMARGLGLPRQGAGATVAAE